MPSRGFEGERLVNCLLLLVYRGVCCVHSRGLCQHRGCAACVVCATACFT